MSRTDLDATTLANSLRMRAGDGSIEWVYEPIQASVLLDIADMLDERDELCAELGRAQLNCDMWHDRAEVMRNRLSAKQAENAKLRELCAGLLTGYECGHGELCKGCTWDGLGDPKTFPCLPQVKARELGVEVEE